MKEASEEKGEKGDKGLKTHAKGGFVLLLVLVSLSALSILIFSGRGGHRSSRYDSVYGGSDKVNELAGEAARQGKAPCVFTPVVTAPEATATTLLPEEQPSSMSVTSADLKNGRWEKVFPGGKIPPIQVESGLVPCVVAVYRDKGGDWRYWQQGQHVTNLDGDYKVLGRLTASAREVPVREDRGIKVIVLDHIPTVVNKYTGEIM